MNDKERISNTANPLAMGPATQETAKRMTDLMSGSSDLKMWAEQVQEIIKGSVRNYEEVRDEMFRIDPDVIRIGEANLTDEQRAVLEQYVTGPVIFQTIHAFDAARMIRLVSSGLRETSPAMFWLSAKLITKDSRNRLPRGIERRLKKKYRPSVNVSYEAPIEFDYST